MYLYYTSVTAPEAEQFKPELSLGGFKSANRVPNDVFNNLFPDISPTTVSNYNQNRYIGLVLKNELPSNANNIYVWFVFPESKFVNFRIAAVEMSLDSESRLFMEHVDTQFSRPVFADFYEADGVDNKVAIGNILAGSQIGIWLESELLIDDIKAAYDDIYVQDPSNSYRYLEVVKETVEQIEIKFSWD